MIVRGIIEVVVLVAVTIFILSIPISASTFGVALRRVAIGAGVAALVLWIASATLSSLVQVTPTVVDLIGFAVLSVVSYIILELRKEPSDDPPWTDFRRMGGKQPIRPAERDPASDATDESGHV